LLLLLWNTLLFALLYAKGRQQAEGLPLLLLLFSMLGGRSTFLDQILNVLIIT
jgi:hypothetical protein